MGYPLLEGLYGALLVGLKGTLLVGLYGALLGALLKVGYLLENIGLDYLF